MKDLQQHREDYLNQFKENTYGRNLLKTDDPFDAPSEECGIFGVYSDNEVDTFSMSQFGLFALQHRGQEACG
ncbi:MAG: amidophosphoribosyltransferase, partial [Flavobacteriales bacterium]|nr:amidophosphoribosyltransferase [Flavobacteriales bacterium]